MTRKKISPDKGHHQLLTSSPIKSNYLGGIHWARNALIQHADFMYLTPTSVVSFLRRRPETYTFKKIHFKRSVCSDGHALATGDYINSIIGFSHRAYRLHAHSDCGLSRTVAYLNEWQTEQPSLLSTGPRACEPLEPRPAYWLRSGNDGGSAFATTGNGCGTS